jgi:hypothetical protein
MDQAAVMAGWCGPGDGDGQEDGAVPEHGDDNGHCGPDGGDGWEDDVVAGHGGDGVGSGQGGGGVALIVEEERDDIVPGCGSEVRDKGAVLGHGDGVEAVGVAVAWTQRRRRACRKFWQPDGVQVKIFRLGFKDRAVGGFIGGQQ